MAKDMGKGKGKDKERVLTKAEQERLDQFETTCQEMTSQGYRKVDLVINMFRANVIAVIALIVLFAALIPLFRMVHPGTGIHLSGKEFIIFLIVFLVLIFAHELVHGLSWACFTPQGFKDVAFGVMRDSLTPYCTCRVPLKKGPYLVGALMPLTVFGIIPIAVSFCTGYPPLLYLGIIMTIAAAGDVMIAIKVLGHKSGTDDVLLYDHPTEAGSVIFER